jgi:SAM-dependent methyltransferase
MHEAAMQYVSAVVDEFGIGGDVLDLGGRDINGTPRHLFSGAYVVVDAQPAPNVDVVADARTLQLDDRFDVVVSTELLEHTDGGAEIVATAHGHLRDGGWFVATMAGPGRPAHSATGAATIPDGEWYRNVEPDELNEWLASAGFSSWSVSVLGDDVRCWARR